MAQPEKAEKELQCHHLYGGMGALEDALATSHREAMAKSRSTMPSAPCNKRPTHQSPIMIEVPSARIPEEPGAVIPHAGICEGGVRQLTSLP